MANLMLDEPPLLANMSGFRAIEGSSAPAPVRFVLSSGCAATLMILSPPSIPGVIVREIAWRSILRALAHRSRPRFREGCCEDCRLRHKPMCTRMVLIIGGVQRDHVEGEQAR